MNVTGAGGLNEAPTASYTNNTNAGTANAANASYAGDANHTGSTDSETFTIDQAPSTTTVTCPTNVTYTGPAQTPCTVNVTGAGGLNQAPTASYTNNIERGTATRQRQLCRRCEPHRASVGQRDLHDRPGGVDDDGDLPDERDLSRARRRRRAR